MAMKMDPSLRWDDEKQQRLDSRFRGNDEPELYAASYAP